MPAMRNLTAARRTSNFEVEMDGLCRYCEVDPCAASMARDGCEGYYHHTVEPVPCDTCTQLVGCSAAYNPEAIDCAFWTDGTEPEPPDIDQM